MIRTGDKVYHFQNSSRLGTVVEIVSQRNNQMTVGGTTDARVFYKVYFPDTKSYEMILSGDVFKHFD
jgi:hypothetical protein